MTDRMRHLPCGQAVNSNHKLHVSVINSGVATDPAPLVSRNRICPPDFSMQIRSYLLISRSRICPFDLSKIDVCGLLRILKDA